ncbi:16838_t:CDS:1, partial [Cetraspora pellucida]
MTTKGCQDTNTNIRQQKDIKIPTPAYDSKRIPRYQHQHTNTNIQQQKDTKIPTSTYD